MISCPRCGSVRWQMKHRCPVDPASDKFRCEDCRHEFKRYDPKETPAKPTPDRPNA